MTAVLQNLRQLDAERRRGELTETEYAVRRAAMMDAVEEAALQAETEAAAGDAARPSAPMNPWLLVALLFAGSAMLTLVGAWAMGDLSLALTFSVTMLAALTVSAFQSLGD